MQRYYEVFPDEQIVVLLIQQLTLNRMTSHHDYRIIDATIELKKFYIVQMNCFNIPDLG